MRSILANLRTLVLPAGATTGRRIVLDGIRGIIQVFRSDGTLGSQLGNDLIPSFEDAFQSYTGDPDEDFPATLSSGISGAGGTRNLFVTLIAPAFVGTSDFPFIELRSRSQNDTTDVPELRIDFDGPQGKLVVPAIIGEAVLVAGTVAVGYTSITALARIFLSRRVVAGAPGNLSYVVTAGTGFTINSDNAGDTSTVEWLILFE